MTGLVESTTADDQSEPGEVRDVIVPTPDVEPARRDKGRFAAINGWRVFGWAACGVAGLLAIGWFIVLGPGELGPKADWFFGAVVFGVVLVAMWQTVTIQRQANRRVAEAAERLRSELAEAEKRSARELEFTRQLHDAQVESQQKAHVAEMDAMQKQARIERTHLLNQLQKQAVTEVSRVIGAHTQVLAMLWNQAAVILHSDDRDEREQAMLPIFERIGEVVNDFSVELGNANQIVEDDRLSQALEAVNEAVLMAIRVAQDVCDDVVEGRSPETNPIPPVARLMHERAAEARRLAWDLLRTGLDD
jgi:hypothetical protein